MIAKYFERSGPFKNCLQATPTYQTHLVVEKEFDFCYKVRKGKSPRPPVKNDGDSLGKTKLDRASTLREKLECAAVVGSSQALEQLNKATPRNTRRTFRAPHPHPLFTLEPYNTRQPLLSLYPPQPFPSPISSNAPHHHLHPQPLGQTPSLLPPRGPPPQSLTARPPPRRPRNGASSTRPRSSSPNPTAAPSSPSNPPSSPSAAPRRRRSRRAWCCTPATGWRSPWRPRTSRATVPS